MYKRQGFERFLPLMNKMKEAGQAKKIYVMKHLDEAVFYMEVMIRYGDIAVLVSGDPLFYSLYRTMKEELKPVSYTHLLYHYGCYYA